MSKLFVCDAQVHAPDRPVESRALASVGGMERPDLEREMDRAGVDRAIIVPLAFEDNGRAIDFVAELPARFATMPVFRPQAEPADLELIRGWRATAGVVGMRTSFYAPASRPLLAGHVLDWLWSAIEEARLPVMINAPDNIRAVGDIAQRHPGLTILLDHMGLTPFKIYKSDDMGPVIEDVVSLAKYPNVAIKASALPSSVAEPFPFPTLHDPIRCVTEAFGSRRVFWGSDLTRIPCTYSECLRLFTDELTFLSDADKRWIVGQGLSSWLGWEVPKTLPAAQAHLPC